MSGTFSSSTAAMIGRAGAWLLRNRRLVRAPIWIYRARLGFVFGSRMLLLEHIGRKTGTPRQVVLEVLGHPAPDTYVVASGFGDRAQWYRNVRADPRVRVAVAGRGPRPATARPLSQAEADLALAAFAERHRAAWDRLKPVLENTLGAAVDGPETPLPMIEFRMARG